MSAALGPMHTFWHRVNAVVTLAIIALMVLAAAASVTDEFHVCEPKHDVSIAAVERLVSVDGADEAYFAIALDLDLRSCWTWNTKQLFVSLAASYVTPSNVAHDAFVYDRIVTSKTDANLTIPRARSKYKLREPEGLLGAEIEWILRWHQMPVAGTVHSANATFPGYVMPDEYVVPAPGARSRPGMGMGTEREFGTASRRAAAAAAAAGRDERAPPSTRGGQEL